MGIARGKSCSLRAGRLLFGQRQTGRQAQGLPPRSEALDLAWKQESPPLASAPRSWQVVGSRQVEATRPNKQRGRPATG